MRAVVQRVTEASVTVDRDVVGSIGRGFVVLLAAGDGDTDADTDYMVAKVAGLRVFEDDHAKMNLSLEDVDGAALVVSQFTLYGDCRKGRRPSFVRALQPDAAAAMVDDFVARLRARGVHVETGVFGADMKVALVNDGPVTLMLDSRKEF